MKQVQSSGVLMVLSQAWIEEVYHQVLDRNLLGEAGYWGSPEDNSLPLITMLTGQWLLPSPVPLGGWEGTLVTSPSGEAAGFDSGRPWNGTHRTSPQSVSFRTVFEFTSPDFSVLSPRGTSRS